MKLIITTSPRSVEVVNFLLGSTIRLVMDNGQYAKEMGLTAKDVLKAEQFRQRLLRQYLKKESNGNVYKN